MNQLVGQSQVADCIVVLMTIEIITIVAECLSQSVAVIKHGSYTVKTEAVEMEFFQPVFAVGQQEVYDFILSVVETERIPCRMFAAVTLIEVLAGIAGKVAQTFHFVLYSV